MMVADSVSSNGQSVTVLVSDGGGGALAFLPESGGTVACGARPAMPAAGTRLTCAGWAAEGGPAPPRPRARAFPAAQSAAIGLPVPGRPLAKPHLGRRRGE